MPRSKPIKVQLKTRVPDAQMQARKGTGVSVDDMGLELHGDADVYMPNGQLLCMLRRDVISKDARDKAVTEFQWMKSKYVTDNRASYTGYKVAGVVGDSTLVRKDGRASRQTRTMSDDGKVVYVSSAIIGYYGRSGRHPFCRQTAFTQNYPDRWNNVLPLIREVDGHMKQTLPKRHAIQRDFAQTVARDFRIPGTAFSTLTVNNNVCGTIHKDKGDYKEGFGVIGCFRDNGYTAGQLCFPQYKVFVDFQDGDLIYFNAHEWHGVNPMVHNDEANPGMRVTVVYYFRENLCECGTPNEERARAQDRFGDLEDPEAHRAQEIVKMKAKEAAADD